MGRVARRGLQALTALLIAASCTTTTEEQPIGIDLNRPVHGQALRAWRLLGEEGTLGYAVEFGDEGSRDAAARTVYSVRNPWQQELGTIDGLGRAWRFQPHVEEAQWLTTGTLAEGVRAILDAPEDTLLEELPLALLEGDRTPLTEGRR